MIRWIWAEDWGFGMIKEQMPTPEEYGRALLPILQPLGCRVIVEPGRAIVGNRNSGHESALYQTERLETVSGVDAAMTRLCIRPALYDAYP